MELVEFFFILLTSSSLRLSSFENGRRIIGIVSCHSYLKLLWKLSYIGGYIKNCLKNDLRSDLTDTSLQENYLQNYLLFAKHQFNGFNFIWLQ